MKSPPIGFVVTHRSDTSRSGVARFNAELAKRLGVPLVQLFSEGLPRSGAALLSFKVSELSADERAAVASILATVDWDIRVFLHDWADSDVERDLVRSASMVYCGNHEIDRLVSALNVRREVLWSPGLIPDSGPFQGTELSVFCFGMAHKLQVDKLTRLRELLDETGRTYGIYMSSANHESASLRNAELVLERVKTILPTNLLFLGELSDVAVSNYLRSTTYFAAFFERGARANNGTLAAAMEHGAVAVTNLDDDSPPDLVHMHNCIDIGRCEALPDEPSVLDAISANAVESSRGRSWTALVKRMHPLAD